MRRGGRAKFRPGSREEPGLPDPTLVATLVAANGVMEGALVVERSGRGHGTVLPLKEIKEAAGSWLAQSGLAVSQGQ